MAKTITFTYKKTAYTLEFTRETVTFLEQNGLSMNDVQNINERPMTSAMLLFRGAFIAHHKKAASIDSLMEEIWNSLPNKNDLLIALKEMYAEPLEALFDDPDDAGKTTWTVNQ